MPEPLTQPRISTTSPSLAFPKTQAEQLCAALLLGQPETNEETEEVNILDTSQNSGSSEGKNHHQNTNDIMAQLLAMTAQPLTQHRPGLQSVNHVDVLRK